MRWLALLLGLAGCDFNPRPVSNEPGDLPDATPEIDAPPPITCGDLSCDPNAVCDPVGPSCACTSGFTGDGMTCADIDECVDANGGCPGLCINSPGDFACAVPVTCAEIKTLIPTAVDGPFTLYLDGNVARPWTAYCHDLAGTPREYLDVGGPTFSQYTAGVNSPGQNVRTTYTRVRILLAPPRIAINDKTFAESTGMLNHDGSGTMVTSMPVGVAMDCRGNNSNTGVARIDLRNTPFEVPTINDFRRDGVMSSGTYNTSMNSRVGDLTGGGNCGWSAPIGAPTNPFNDRADGVTLPITYD